MIATAVAAGHTCTSSACTWSEAGNAYTTRGFVVGLVFIVVVVLAARKLLPVLFRAARRAGRRFR